MNVELSLMKRDLLCSGGKRHGRDLNSAAAGRSRECAPPGPEWPRTLEPDLVAPPGAEQVPVGTRPLTRRDATDGTG
jgi:hypothetical protein